MGEEGGGSGGGAEGRQGGKGGGRNSRVMVRELQRRYEVEQFLRSD